MMLPPFPISGRGLHGQEKYSTVPAVWQFARAGLFAIYGNILQQKQMRFAGGREGWEQLWVLWCWAPFSWILRVSRRCIYSRRAERRTGGDRPRRRQPESGGGHCQRGAAALRGLVDTTWHRADVIRKLQDHKVSTDYIRAVPDGMGTWLAVFDNGGDVVASISKRPDLRPIGHFGRSRGQIFPMPTALPWRLTVTRRS